MLYIYNIVGLEYLYKTVEFYTDIHHDIHAESNYVVPCLKLRHKSPHGVKHTTLLMSIVNTPKQRY